MRLRSNYLRVTPLVLMCGLMCLPCAASAQQSVLSNPPQAVSTAMLYHFLFHYVVHLQSKHPDVESLQNGYLADFLGRQLNLKPEDELLVLREAAQCEIETQQIDAQAKAIIDKMRSAAPNGSLPAAPGAQLIKLQLDKDQTIQNHVAALQMSLSPGSFSSLDNNVRTKFGRHIYTSTVSNQTGSSEFSTSR
jgi:hypothetical protein